MSFEAETSLVKNERQLLIDCLNDTEFLALANYKYKYLKFFDQHNSRSLTGKTNKETVLTVLDLAFYGDNFKVLQNESGVEVVAAKEAIKYTLIFLVLMDTMLEQFDQSFSKGLISISPYKILCIIKSGLDKVIFTVGTTTAEYDVTISLENAAYINSYTKLMRSVCDLDLQLAPEYKHRRFKYPLTKVKPMLEAVLE